MRYALLVAFLLPILVSLPVSVNAGDTTPENQTYLDGNQLLGACEEAAGCRGYIIGVVDEYAVMTASFDLPRRFCLPPNVPASQLERDVTKWLKEHPQNLHMIASSLVVVSLYEAFPCETKK